jgi:hypothetical protein
MMNKINVFEEKHLNEVHTLNNTYKNFEEFLLRNGHLLHKDTKIGYWATTPVMETFEVLNQLIGTKADINSSKAGSEINSWKNRKFKSCRSFCDLGSGDGRVVLLASLFNIKKAVGIEADDWLNRVSLHMKSHVGFDQFSRTKFLKKDFFDHNIRGFDYVFICPDRPFYRGLEEKMKNELDGRLIVFSRVFHPEHLKLEKEFNINGERFCVYRR